MMGFTVCDIHPNYGVFGCDAVQLVILELFRREIDFSETPVRVVGGCFPREGGAHPPYRTLSLSRSHDRHLVTLLVSNDFL
jgi:hypothetical protein